jgi:hypothetical protein
MRVTGFVHFVLFGLMILSGAGCYGERTRIEVRLTDKSHAPLPQRSLRIYPPLRVVPTLPVTWGTTGSDGIAVLDVPKGEYQGFFYWKGSLYKFVIWVDGLRPGDFQLQESRPEPELLDGPVINVELRLPHSAATLTPVNTPTPGSNMPSHSPA